MPLGRRDEFPLGRRDEFPLGRRDEFPLGRGDERRLDVIMKCLAYLSIGKDIQAKLGYSIHFYHLGLSFKPGLCLSYSMLNYND